HPDAHAGRLQDQPRPGARARVREVAAPIHQTRRDPDSTENDGVERDGRDEIEDRPPPVIGGNAHAATIYNLPAPTCDPASLRQSGTSSRPAVVRRADGLDADLAPARHASSDRRTGRRLCLPPGQPVSGYVCVWTVGDAVAARTRSARSVRSTRSATGAGTGVGTGEGGVALLAA